MYWLIWIALAVLVVIGVAAWVVRRRRGRNRPMRAIALLQSRARLLSDTKLRAAIDRAWGVRLPDIAPEGSADFIIVAPGTPSAVIQIAGVSYLVNSFPSPYMNDPASAASEIADLRLRTIVADHKAWMSVDLLGDLPDGWDEPLLYTRLAKLAAEIAAEDTLGFFFPQFSLLYPNTGDTLAALRSENALESLRANGSMPVVSVSDDDPEIRQAVEEAQARLPEFVRRFESREGEHFSVKAPITSAGHTEFIWIDVTSVSNDEVIGALGNDPANLAGYKLGQRVRVRLDEIVDWMIVTDRENQKFDGGFSVAVVMKRYAEQAK